MPKQDFNLTRRLRDAGFFACKDSYVDLDGHLILDGLDKSLVRPKMFKKYKNRCCVCGHKLREQAPPFHPECGAWHHPGPCSCVECTDLRCDVTTGRDCHAHRTAGAQFDRKRQAAADFDKVHDETEN
jgi:hypothetical protein